MTQPQPQPQPKDRRDPRVREIEAQIGALFAELKELVQPTPEECEQSGDDPVFLNDPDAYEACLRNVLDSREITQEANDKALDHARHGRWELAATVLGEEFFNRKTNETDEEYVRRHLGADINAYDQDDDSRPTRFTPNNQGKW